MANLHGGGAERVTTNIIKQLDKEKFDITLLMVLKEGVFLNEIPSYVNIIDLNVKKTIFSIFKLYRVIAKIRPDIIYSTMIHTSIALDIALSFIKSLPYSILRNPTSPKLLMEEGQLSFIWRFFLLRAYRNASKILAQTPEMKNEITQYYKVRQKKIDILINPLDTENMDNKIKSIENPFNVNKINIVSAGRLTYAKAFDTLLYAFEKVLKENNNFMLHIIGRDDGEEKKLKELCKILAIEEYVNFLGFQENPYKYFYYSDLYVLSSRREGLPNTVLENLYFKKPIIATDCIPFMYELIDNGKNGFIVHVDDPYSMAKAILNFKKLKYDESKKFIMNNINSYFNKIESLV